MIAPSKWKEFSLGEIAQYLNGKAFKPADWGNQGFPIIRIQNLTDPEKPFNYFDGNIEDRYQIDTGDLLISWSATLGSFIWNRGPAVLNQHIFKVLPNTHLVDKEFLHFLVLTTLDEMAKNSHGLAMKHITKKKFEALKVTIPPLAEQRHIVARIKVCMERVEEIEELQNSITSECSIMPTASKHDLWNECSRLFDPIPLGKAVLSAKNGLYKPKKFHGSGTVLLRMFNIKDGELILDRIERLQATEKESVDFAVMNGNIIVSRVNSRELVGKSAFVQGLEELAVNEAMIIRLQIDENKADGRFLTWLMNSPQFLHDLRGRAKHAIGQSSINQSLTQKPGFCPLHSTFRQRLQSKKN